MKQYLQKLSERQSLTEMEMKQAAELLLSDEISESEIAAFLIALKSKGETADEIAGLVNVLLKKAVAISPNSVDAMDNCGTGGDGSNSFNISTTSAFVIAGAGIKVAKHGNKSISSKTGSSDVLEYLGVDLHLDPEQTAEMLKENGIAFLYAPSVHPKIGKIMKVRRELRIPTVFNFLGPLINPVPLKTQLLGINNARMLELFGHVLNKIGRKRAVIIHGAGGMDEASLQGENHLLLLDDGELTSFKLHPEEVNLAIYDNQQIIGGNAAENGKIMLRVLKGEKGPYRDTVLLNAGIGIFTNGKSATILEGIKLAEESIDSGNAFRKLDYLISYRKKITGVS